MLFSLLLVAIYQLLHDKAESFTVVNQAVRAATQFKKPPTKPWAKGLVNGVLRNFLRQQADLKNKIAQNETAIFLYLLHPTKHDVFEDNLQDINKPLF